MSIEQQEPAKPGLYVLEVADDFTVEGIRLIDEMAIVKTVDVALLNICSNL